jgi:predicted SprT family Zn-dependent metalloprotease
MAVLRSAASRQKALNDVELTAPALQGRTIRVIFRGPLHISRGKLIFNLETGTAVHAATFLHRRQMILDRVLLDNPSELRRIVLHELFHFVWWRLGNDERRDWERVLSEERARKASGELGWSAECRKTALTAHDVSARTRRWREYACEAFCDSAAWMYGDAPHHEHTLPHGFRARRREWMNALAERRPLRV